MAKRRSAPKQKTPAPLFDGKPDFPFEPEPAKATIVVQDRFVTKLCQALGLDPAKTTRIIIDANANNQDGPYIVNVHVELLGDTRLLILDWVDDDIKIVRADPEPTKPEHHPHAIGFEPLNGRRLLHCCHCGMRGFQIPQFELQDNCGKLLPLPSYISYALAYGDPIWPGPCKPRSHK